MPVDIMNDTKGYTIPSSNQARPSIISRRELLRAACLAGGWVTFAPLIGRAQTASDGLTPAQQGIDASGELEASNWKPAFFTAEQNETLIVLSDVMIPATETPGAKQALVNRYLDLFLAAETPEHQQKFLASLLYVDNESLRVFGEPFTRLTNDEQVDLLIPMAYPDQVDDWITENNTISGQEHFSRLKSSIAEAYYSSEIGMQALGWDGAYAHGKYLGCPADEHK